MSENIDSPDDADIDVDALIDDFIREKEEEKKELKKALRAEIDKMKGCEHYKRKCEVLSPCCNKYYSCRICHDKKENKYNPENVKIGEDGKFMLNQHVIDRFKIKYVRCLECKKEQIASNKCVGCGITFARYYCDICHLYDNYPNKDIFHCDKCGFCRLGLKEKTKHCDVCCMCFDKDYKHDSKECLKDYGKNAKCPVCLDILFLANAAIYMNTNCPHHLHYKCYYKLIQNHHYNCVICSKSMLSTTQQEENNKFLDEYVQGFNMPDEYKDKKTNILCNECNVKSQVKLHFIGIQCPNCKSFNTKQI